MIRAIVLAIALGQVPGGATAPSRPDRQFDSFFTDRVLRLDLSHTVTDELDLMSLDRIQIQGAWAGPRKLTREPATLGAYRLDVVAVAGGELLFSRGWDSIAAEHRATAPAKVPIARTFQESVLIPMPRHPVAVKVHRMDVTGDRLILERTVDPDDLAIGRSAPASDVTIVEQRISGPPSSTLDILFVGEGYTAAEEDVFRTDLTRFAGLLLGHEPFAAMADRISVRGVVRASTASGCDEPTRDRWVDTAVGASFNALGSPRYLLTEREWAVRDIASAAPYDALLIMVNHDRYGGGGLYNTWCTFTAHGPWSDYLLLHEFGHSFAGLADEYYTSSVAYEDLLPPGVEPRAPNITALLDPDALKWRHLVIESTPLPTPWPKAEYDRRDLPYQKERRRLDAAAADAARRGDHEEAARLSAHLEAFTTQHVASMKALLSRSEYAGAVGAFEGGGYATTGLYRPAQDCLMFSRGVQPWCPVCRAAVERTVRGFLE
jgi:hypothetical protein